MLERDAVCWTSSGYVEAVFRNISKRPPTSLKKIQHHCLRFLVSAWYWASQIRLSMMLHDLGDSSDFYINLDPAHYTL